MTNKNKPTKKARPVKKATKTKKLKKDKPNPPIPQDAAGDYINNDYGGYDSLDEILLSHGW
jgi:hypothetical protein